MKTIHKYIIGHSSGIQTIQMPGGSVILSVQEQHSAICIWAEVDTRNKLRDYQFHTIPTGMELPKMLGAYLGTVQLCAGDLVYHVYEARSW